MCLDRRLREKDLMMCGLGLVEGHFVSEHRLLLYLIDIITFIYNSYHIILYHLKVSVKRGILL